MVSYYKTKLRFFIMFSKPKETKNDDDDDDDDDDDIEQPDKSMAQTCQTNPSYNPIDAVWYNYPQNEAIFCKIHSTNIKYATAQKKKNTIDGIVFDEVKNQGSSATYGRLCSHHYALNVGYAYCVHQQMNGSCCPIPSLVTNTRRFITVACTSLLQKSSALAFNQIGS
eukprot:1157268_1